MTTTDAMCRRRRRRGRRSAFPSGRDIWFFVLFESLVFPSYFCVYLFNRTQHEQAFLLGQSHLLLWLGVLDTIVLLLKLSGRGPMCPARPGPGDSSVPGEMATADRRFWVGLPHPQDRRVGPVDSHGGNTFTSSQFFQYYFFLTAIHCVHLLVGFVVLGVLVYQLSSEKRRSQVTVETCATSWHSVDFFWVLIFRLLYVVR